MARVAGIVAEGRQGQADWLAATAGRHAHRGPRPARRRARGRGRRPPAERRAHLPQRRRARRRAGSARRPRGADADQLEPPRARRAARASRGGRRRLHRARVRPGLPPPRRRGHRRREGTAADRPRGPGRLRGDPRHPRGRGRARPHPRRVHPLRAACATGIAVGVDCATGAPEEIGEPRAPGDGPAAQHRRPRARGGRASPPTGAASSPSTTGWRPAFPGIWALGECNGRGAFTHTAYNDYEIVAANLLDGGDRKVTDRLPAYALFTDPPLGRAGHDRGRGASPPAGGSSSAGGR